MRVWTRLLTTRLCMFAGLTYPMISACRYDFFAIEACGETLRHTHSGGRSITDTRVTHPLIEGVRHGMRVTARDGKGSRCTHYQGTALLCRIGLVGPGDKAVGCFSCAPAGPAFLPKSTGVAKLFLG